ncbi:unnamed protein product [Strongylus vulgaris]|uniref:Flap endonuclease 1 n=1 Tax=Strongylus vulgaris TaxID=40348 RepID=A0A3P7J545_STRVU|nr:unnamed protein product [Strongylus vulgaris]
MGIKDLSKVIADNAPNAIKLNEMKNYFGRKVAIDASMCLYQFLIAVRQDGSQLQSESGETTSHLMGMFYRTIRMIDNGVKPCYVFDGKPPDMKSGELEKRSEKRAEAEKALTEAKERGDTEAVDKFERRLVKVTKEQNEDVKKLLRLMGVPIVEAPCEAEAQCAALVRAKKVYGTATEDMDALTFGSDVLLRHMTFAEAKKMPIKEFLLPRILSDFDMTKEQFIDLCILLGCDYCESIRGIGPKKAYELIKTYGDIESILENIDLKAGFFFSRLRRLFSRIMTIIFDFSIYTIINAIMCKLQISIQKYQPPENWPYKRARELFLNPEVAECETINLVWKEPDVDGIISFMCGEKNFNWFGKNLMSME